MDEIIYHPIGIVHSPFKEPEGVPIQSSAAMDIEGSVEIFPEYKDGLKDLDGFSHIVLLVHFHLSKGYSLIVVPYMDNEPRGVFATHAPRRPNPIGISVVRLVKIEGNLLRIKGMDMVDGTPVLDIKPYVPHFELNDEDVRIGWMERRVHKLRDTRDDGRFI